jgi:hypothetical protein
MAITSREDRPTGQVCCMCKLFPGFGKWDLCPGCRDELAQRLSKRHAVCRGCGDLAFLVDGTHCAHCKVALTYQQEPDEISRK